MVGPSPSPGLALCLPGPAGIVKPETVAMVNAVKNSWADAGAVLRRVPFDEAAWRDADVAQKAAWAVLDAYITRLEALGEGVPIDPMDWNPPT